MVKERKGVTQVLGNDFLDGLQNLKPIVLKIKAHLAAANADRAAAPRN